MYRFDSDPGHKSQNEGSGFFMVLMFSVYAIASLSRTYIYVGMTNDLARRLDEHNSGANSTTKPYRPFLHFYTKEFADRAEARNWEKYLKSGVGKELLKSVLGDQAG